MNIQNPFSFSLLLLSLPSSSHPCPATANLGGGQVSRGNPSLVAGGWPTSCSQADCEREEEGEREKKKEGERRGVRAYRGKRLARWLLASRRQS